MHDIDIKWIPEAEHARLKGLYKSYLENDGYPSSEEDALYLLMVSPHMESPINVCEQFILFRKSRLLENRMLSVMPALDDFTGWYCEFFNKLACLVEVLIEKEGSFLRDDYLVADKQRQKILRDISEQTGKLVDSLSELALLDGKGSDDDPSELSSFYALYKHAYKLSSEVYPEQYQALVSLDNPTRAQRGKTALLEWFDKYRPRWRGGKSNLLGGESSKSLPPVVAVIEAMKDSTDVALAYFKERYLPGHVMKQKRSNRDYIRAVFDSVYEFDSDILVGIDGDLHGFTEGFWASVFNVALEPLKDKVSAKDVGATKAAWLKDRGIKISEAPVHDYSNNPLTKPW